MMAHMTRNDELYAMRATAFTLLISWTLRYRSLVLFQYSFPIMVAFHRFTLSPIVKVQKWAELRYLLLPALAYVAIYFSTNWYGQHELLAAILCLLGGVSCLLSISFDSDPPALGKCLLIMGKVCASMAVTVNYIYQEELFPAVVRSVGICYGYA